MADSKSSSKPSGSRAAKTKADRENEQLGKVEPTKAALKEAEEVKDIQIDVHHENVTNVPTPSANAVILDPVGSKKTPVVLSFEDTGPQSTLVAVDGKPVGLINGQEQLAAFARKARRVI